MRLDVRNLENRREKKKHKDETRRRSRHATLGGLGGRGPSGGGGRGLHGTRRGREEPRNDLCLKNSGGARGRELEFQTGTSGTKRGGKRCPTFGKKCLIRGNEINDNLGREKKRTCRGRQGPILGENKETIVRGGKEGPTSTRKGTKKGRRRTGLQGKSKRKKKPNQIQKKKEENMGRMSKGKKVLTVGGTPEHFLKKKKKKAAKWTTNTGVSQKHGRA